MPVSTSLKPTITIISTTIIAILTNDCDNEAKLIPLSRPQMHGYGIEQDHALAHHQLPQYMEEGGPPMGHPYSHPSSNPSAQFPGTPSELSSTSSD